MRHGRKAKKFRREKGPRKALFVTLATQLLEYGRIRTGLEKAKYLRGVVEPLITRAKSGTVHDRREVSRIIHNPETLKKLFSEIAPLYKDRKGGYTRVLHMDARPGDNAEMALIELIGSEALYKKEEPKDAAKAKKDAKEAKKVKADAKKEEKPEKKEKKEEKKEVKKEEKKEVKKEVKKDADKKAK
jgi:large subunit ribosomal protein L17